MDACTFIRRLGPPRRRSRCRGLEYAASSASSNVAYFASVQVYHDPSEPIVDPETGKVDVVRYTAAQDAGKAIHPGYVEGQYQGGAAQGIGWALNEEYIYDENGAMENPGFLDYRVPLASDLPMIETIVVEVPNAFHPYGVRGVGESGIIPPLAAVATSVGNAIDRKVEELPCSPPRVLALLQNGK